MQAAKRDRLIELLSTFLLSIAALTEGWAGYQANLWNSQMSQRFSEAQVLRTHAANLSSAAVQMMGLDASVFVQYVTALTSHNRKLAQFLRDRFRPEAKPALEAWIRTHPLNTPGAPPTPFAMPQYKLKASTDAVALEKQATQKFTEGTAANHNNDDYTRITVFLASVTFLAGISTRITNAASRAALNILGATILLASIVSICTLPLA